MNSKCNKNKNTSVSNSK